MIILFHNEIFPCEGSFTWMSLKLHLVYFPVHVYGCVCVCVYIYIYADAEAETPILWPSDAKS